MRFRHTHIWLLAFVGVLCVSSAPAERGMDMPFTYQGQLMDDGEPVTDLISMRFSLWDAAAGGLQLGTDYSAMNVDVVDGLFTAQIDTTNFGPDAFTGDPRWLEIEVWEHEADWVLLSPRQMLTASPFALYAFDSPGGGGTCLWSEHGGDISYNTGDVGIGTTTPIYKLHVTDTGGGTAVAGENTGEYNYGYLGHEFAGVYASNNAPYADGKAIWGVTTGPNGFGGYFEGQGYFSGNVGVGVTNPSEKLDVAGMIRTTRFKLTTTPTAGHVLTSDANGVGTWQPGGGGSLWQENGSNIYYDSGNVGIGITNPARPLDVVSNDTASAGHFSNTFAGPGGNGLTSETSATGASGVLGKNTAPTGEATGVYGVVWNPDGWGVRGVNWGASGDSVGVYGLSDSPSGKAVHGLANTASGTNYGVYGETNSSSGYGVYGSSEDGYGVSGRVDGGKAVYGVHDDTGNFGYLATSTEGAYGEHGASGNFGRLGTAGEGVYGETSNAGDYAVHAVHTAADSDDTPGVYGEHAVTDHYGIGVKGVGGYRGVDGCVMPTGIGVYTGVYGEVTSSTGTGTNRGVVGYASGGATNYGVSGHHANGNFGHLGTAEAGVHGESYNADDNGVCGVHTLASDDTPGVYGEHAVTDHYGIGVKGVGGHHGVAGYVWPTGDSTYTGIYGEVTSSTGTGTNRGVLGYASGGATNYGVSGHHASGNFGQLGTAEAGVHGETSNSFEYAVRGLQTYATSNTPAVYGENAVTDHWGVGVQGIGGLHGVEGQVYPDTDGTQSYSGVHGYVYGGDGTNHGVKGTGSNGVTNYGVYGYASGSGATNYGVYGDTWGGDTAYAGYFSGDVHCSGTLSKGGGTFMIDHPLDPENKYLYHSFVESPDMMNIYNGNVTTDKDGYATIEMPEWFETLNMEFRYQLTVIDAADSDSFVMVKVVRKIVDNQFAIRTSEPNVEVSWQVTGIRQDPFANANRVQVEVDKREDEIGTYLHPEAWGQPAELQLDRVREARELQEKEAMAAEMAD